MKATGRTTTVAITGIPHLNARIGIAVRRLRNQCDLTQKELASMVGVTPESICMLERGSRSTRFNLEALQRIAVALGLGG